MKLLVLILLILLILSLSVDLEQIKNNPYHYLMSKMQEYFVVSIKDRQKLGTIDNENGSQPKSSWKSGNQNYESCYSTETRNGNTTGRNRNFYCNNGIDGSEAIPYDGLYNIDLTNYNVHPGKSIKGNILSGSYVFNNKTYNLNDGMVSNENALTLSQSKLFCDSLKEKCRGFIMIIPSKDINVSNQTIFFSSLEEGWEDPDVYAKLTKENITSLNTVSYIKKDVNYIEKTVSNDLFKKTSDKYINLPTCNPKSSNRCLFKDYIYDQSRDQCIHKINTDQRYNISELKQYDNNRLSEWLKNVAYNDIGNDKLTSGEANVREYINRCKEVDGLEFLSNTELPIQYVPTTQPGNVKGRYVRITINNRDTNQNWLQLAEVQIINNNKNIAFGKLSNSSGNYPGSANSKANDGNNDGNWNNGSVYHSGNGTWNNDGSPQFWEVDLGDASQTIDRIIVSNRSDCCKERLHNWLLSIYDNNKNLIWARIYPNHPNPKVIIDIKASDNDMNNKKIKDFENIRFNKFFYRVSNTEFNSKRGWTSECAEQCHKDVCEGEKKKWIGNNNWYGCRDYNPGEREKEIADDLERKRKEEERKRLESLKVIFSAVFYQWQTPTAEVQRDWVNFRRKLTGVYDTMHIYNNLGGNFKVTTPQVNHLAQALREGRHGFRIDLGGKTWRVLQGCIVWSSYAQNDQIYLTTDPWDCSCGSPGHWTIRPMINNYNWGGGPNAYSCWAQTQTMTLEFSNSNNNSNIDFPFITEINNFYSVNLIERLFGGPRQLNLLWKATRDGWTANEFHNRCNNKGPTLTIVRSAQGFIAGGYTKTSWASRNNYVHVDRGDAFLFSVSSGNVTKFVNSRYPQYSLYDSQWHGPIFGGGHDLFIGNNAHTLTWNYTNPHSYQGTALFNSSGFSQFTPNEIEVYQVI